MRLDEAGKPVMRVIIPILLAATRSHAYWYPNSYTRTPSADEDCYSQANDPYSITCYATNDFVYAPCSDLFIPSTPFRPNNFTYCAICTFPDAYAYDEGDFWSDIITVDVCENYWDACISDNPLAKYDDTIDYGRSECGKVTDSACGSHRVDEFSIPLSEPEDTTSGAFDLGPYSTVSQVTVPRISLGSETTAAVSGKGSTGVVVGSTTATSQTSSLSEVSLATSMISKASASPASQSASSAAVAQITQVSKAGGRISDVPSMIATSMAAFLIYALMI